MRLVEAWLAITRTSLDVPAAELGAPTSVQTPMQKGNGTYFKSIAT